MVIKHKISPNMIYKVGHMIKLGCSTRSYILTGPEEDEEDESEHGVTELQKLRAEELAKRADEAKETEEKEKAEAEARRKKEVEQGIDWGLGEDADEKMDLTDNPFAQTNNEELYIDDPKKALRGFMEREGHDLDYDCSEQGFGQFLCKVELPLDDEFGRPIVAEVLHKGKKKEAVFQCALEACKILDRYGVLRKATHESRKRKPRNWEENDYYDSDEDTFLDRTGTIEKKREKRKQATQPQQPETYQTLIVKEKELSEQIQEIEKQLYESNKRNTSDASSTDADSLDSFMKELKQSKPDKQTIRKLKTDHVRLKAEHDRIVRLANLAKPTDMPALVSWDQKPQTGKTSAFSGSQKAKTLPMFGKRLKVKVQVPVHNKEMDVDADGEEKEDETNEVPETEILRVEATNTPTDKQNDAEPKTEDTANMVEGEECDEETPEEREKRRKRNQKRIQQRKEKAEMERQRAYKLDSHRQGYDMWVPPSNQTGDGRTSLNDKLGY